jgi:tryptophan-rich sensory protein
MAIKIFNNNFMKNFFKIITAIIISQLAGIIGSIFTMPSILGWYAGLVKPELSPPNWIFAPVWTILFLLMGVAGGLVWIKKDYRALTAFAVQLILNTTWSVIFFGLHSPGWAFVEIIFLWFAILATIIVFAKTSRVAAWMLAPYIIWVTFASYLNFMIWSLN